MARRTIHPAHLAMPKNLCRLPNGYGVVKIGVSGSADLAHLGLDVFDRAKEIGREIAKHGAMIVTGATTGFPMYAAMGAKDECGLSIGFSPASTEREHLELYKLPMDYMDIVVYTSFGYSGRDLFLVRSSDAMIIGPGRIGTINEFAVAFEDQRPVGILEGPWDTDEIIHLILDAAHRPNPNIIFDSDHKRLVERLIEMVQKNKDANKVYNRSDEWMPDGKAADVIV